MTRTLFLLCLAALLFSVACQSAPVQRHTHERLHSTLYLQRSAEYPALCRQIYRAAAEKLDAALKDPQWTALEEQTGDYATLPPAVLIDLDETVFDNSPYYAQVVRKDDDFDLKQWNRWVVQAQAELLPGAAEFIAAAQKAGVAVYFITNRDARLEGFTRLNLARRGIALDPKVDTLLMQGETPEWKHDKSSRRLFVAKTHRVLLNLGDDLNDFAAIGGMGEQERKAIVARTADRWGDRWFLLPNPGYGNWIDDIMKNVLDDQAQLDRKYEALRPAPEIGEEEMRALMQTPIPPFPIQLYIETFALPAAPSSVAPQQPDTPEEQRATEPPPVPAEPSPRPE